MKRVIIVDDAIDLGRMLQDALRVAHPGTSITIVPSGEEALLESTRFLFDLLVTDLRLPGMSGVELIRKIRQRQPNIKIILMTALKPENVLFRQKEEVNPDIFMRKPVTVAGFLEAVEQLIGAPEPANPPPVETAPVQPAGAEPAEALLNELASVMPGEPVGLGPEPVKKVTAPLNRTAESPSADGGLSEILIQLRSRCSALSAILLDDRGRLVAQAGDLAGMSLEEELALQVITSLSAGANIAHLLGKAWNNSAQAFRGAEIDLVLAPVSQYALVLALRSGRSALRLALAIEETLIAQAELISTLEGLGLRLQAVSQARAADEAPAYTAASQQTSEEEVSPDVLATPLGQDQELEKIEELIHKKTTGELKIEDPDIFWESASPGESGEIPSPGILSFEEAQKLGLIPPAEEE